MAYTTESLLEEVALKVQSHPRYTVSLRLKGLNRGLVDLERFLCENLKVDNVLNPLDPTDSTRYAMEFPLPADALFVQSMSFNGRPLRKLSQPEFVNTGGEFDVVAESGLIAPSSFASSLAPTSYYIRAGRFVNLWPRPTNQRTVQTYYQAAPAKLVNPAAPATEVPELNSAYSDALIFYTVYWCALGVPGEEKRAEDFRALYLQERARVKFDLSSNSEHKIVRDK